MLKVLIVEDDFMIADCLEEILVESGYEVCGIAANLAEAVELGDRCSPDLGIIDLRLADGTFGTEVAAVLRRRATIGILYATGNPHHPLLNMAEGEGCIGKPYSAASVLSGLSVVVAMMARTPGSAARPPGFRALNRPSDADAASSALRERAAH